MSKGIDLSHIYNLRNNFTIIGLTGQIGSGCSEVAEQLSRGFRYGDFENPREVGVDIGTSEFKHNAYRKYRIVYNYAMENFKEYLKINYKDVLILSLLQYKSEEFIGFLHSPELKKELNLIQINSDLEDEIAAISTLQEQFKSLSENFKSLNIENITINNKFEELYNFYFKSGFLIFCNSLHAALRKHSRVKRNKVLQVISTNLRKSGNPFKFSEPSADNIFKIVELINYLIKSVRKSLDGKVRTQVVIDDLRNPIEIMYFKQRYAAFYTIAVHREKKPREDGLHDKYTTIDFEAAKILCKDDYKGGKSDEFYKANISACIQQADIHISLLTTSEAAEKNLEIQTLNAPLEKIGSSAIDNTSPYFSWKMQLLKFVSLISHPGLITPTPEERCMQMAYTAKHNSGCISRHVGAAITDENYSIKAIGWNNTPAGQVSCVLRNAEDLLDRKNDISAFTTFETTDSKFSKSLSDNFRVQVEENRQNLKGRNVCFCFKDVKNSCSDGKNQVHTRSLHAEESAFLQIAKYGGIGIENGKLFTTASPCELCAKKAYQLGIKVIYYIDPYPGISDDHILSTGSKPIKPRLFDGAIGNAYHWLYDPVMPYKDEMTLLLGNKFDDYATKQEKKAEFLQNHVETLKQESVIKDEKIIELELKIRAFEKK
jgi:deoxycytidylate deaminase